MTTKISKSRLGDIRFPKHDKPFDNSVTTMKLTPEQMDHYLKTGELPNRGKEIAKEIIEKAEKHFSEKAKKKRGRPKMKSEQAQEKVNLNDELAKLEQEVAELSKTNDSLKQELDDLLDRYNKLSLDYETAEQVRYDLTRVEGQRDQLKASLKETEDILFKEVDRRDLLEKLLKMYLP